MAETTGTRKKVAKKKAAKKPTRKKQPDSSASILKAIKAELAEEYLEKEQKFEEERAALQEHIERLEDELNAASSEESKSARFQERLKTAQAENTALKRQLNELEPTLEARETELAKREEALKEEASKFEKERGENINNIVNQRTERMKKKLDEEHAERAQQMAQQILVGQDVQVRELYNILGTQLKNSKAPPIVMNQVLGLLQQTLLLEQRRRYGVDAPAQPTPPAPPVPPTEEAPTG